MKDSINVRNLTKDYGHGRGIFNINLSVKEGEVFGIVGINGSGKTTTIRHLMGFLKPDKGSSSIQGMDCWRFAPKLKERVGYIPGEIAFPDAKTGTDFLKWQADFLGIDDMTYAKKLIERFNLDPDAKLKRMSKGMKQKTAIVSAFMADPDILLLDEATTGLDPLMQRAFIDLILEEKKKGKTIFTSSHMFDELESTCDRVAFLKDGNITETLEMGSIRGNESVKEYKIEFVKQEDYLSFIACPFEVIRLQEEFNQVTVHIPDREIGLLFRSLSDKTVRYITHKPLTLETYFKSKYNDSEVA